MRERSSALTAAHPLDRAVAWLSRNSRMFARGWGDEGVLAESTRRERYLAPPEAIQVQWDSPRNDGGRTCRDGTFRSPLDMLPDAVRTAHVRWWSRPGNTTACVMPAASRDEGYGTRERVFGALVDQGIDVYFLENPYYGARRTTSGPSDLTVAEHCLMALGMVQECRALLESVGGTYGKLVAAGYSMGGHMAALTAAVSPFPVACAAMAAGASPTPIYTQAALSRSVDFGALGGEAGRQRLREVLGGADLTRFRVPLRPDAAIVAGCTRDGYVLQSETERLHRHWKQSTLRWIPAGHFSALITQRRVVRECVREAANRL